MRAFRTWILLVACVAIATLAVGRSKAQTETPAQHPDLEYGVFSEDHSTGSVNFIVGSRLRIDGGNYKDFADKLGVTANRQAVLGQLGAWGWSLVCIDREKDATEWYFVRAK